MDVFVKSRQSKGSMILSFLETIPARVNQIFQFSIFSFISGFSGMSVFDEFQVKRITLVPSFNNVFQQCAVDRCQQYQSRMLPVLVPDSTKSILMTKTTKLLLLHSNNYLSLEFESKLRAPNSREVTGAEAALAWGGEMAAIPGCVPVTWAVCNPGWVLRTSVRP